VWVETTLYYSKSVLLTSMISPFLRGRVNVIYRGGIGVLRVVPATCKGFLEMFTQIWSLSGPAVMHKLACSHYSKRQTFLFYAWGLAYYKNRSLTEIYSELSVSLLSFYRNRDTLIAPRTLIWNEHNLYVLCRNKRDRKQ